MSAQDGFKGRLLAFLNGTPWWQHLVILACMLLGGALTPLGLSLWQLVVYDLLLILGGFYLTWLITPSGAPDSKDTEASAPASKGAPAAVPVAAVDAQISHEALAALLTQIEKNDKQYATREVLVFRAVSLAKMLGIPAGVHLASSTGDGAHWPVMCIRLPEGEVSWHCLAYVRPPGGYDTAETYRRARLFAARYVA